jgi:C4-dicarboxylate-specific signal transduction histidine kinase
MDTRSPEGHAPPELADQEAVRHAIRMRAPTIATLVRDPANGWLFAVHVPVLRDTTVRYVVSALITPEEIRDVLTRQQFPADWVVSIMNADDLRVARSEAHEENVGGHLWPTAQKIVDGGAAEGFGVSYTLEGDRIFTPYSRLASSGWIAVLGLPTASFDAAAYRSVGMYATGVVLSIVLLTLLALWAARSIVTPMAELRVAAEALSHGELARAPETSIREIREVGAALQSAAADLAKSEAARDDLLRQERVLRETAEGADRAKDQFLGVLSHELRTPLNAVYGWARMLQTGQFRDDAAASRAKNAIVRNANMQIQLIDDLLDLSRITTGKMRLDVRHVDVAGVLAAALDAVRPAADAKTIRVQTTVDANAGSIVGDAARLQQIVWNLLINAVKFTP